MYTNAKIERVKGIIASEVDGELWEDGDAVHVIAPGKRHHIKIERPRELDDELGKELVLSGAVHRLSKSVERRPKSNVNC